MNANVADIIAAYVTGERWMSRDTSQKRPTREEIAQLAYYLYEFRGRQDGHDVEDWLRAEERLARTAALVRDRHAESDYLHTDNGGSPRRSWLSVEPA